MSALLIALPALAVVIALARMWANRRRRRMNRIAHELRRPLQAIALAVDPASAAGQTATACIEQARLALADLDREINGRPPGRGPMLTGLSAVIGAVADRWAPADVEVRVPPPDATVLADPARLGAAIDNLVANGLRHGSGRVRVRTAQAGGEALIEVRDDGPSAGRLRHGHDPRRGHGLGIAAESVAGSGGRLIGPVPAGGGGTVATIALPAAPAETVG